MPKFKDVIKIAKVATDGSKIVESTKTGHITYDIYYWDSGDEDHSGYWYYGGAGSTDAKITGSIISQSNMKINGISVAVVGDLTYETWEASPPVPSDDSYTQYRNVSPGESGSGNGSITSGNSKNAKLNGKLIAVVGSQVTTCLGNTTTIEDGNDLINM